MTTSKKQVIEINYGAFPFTIVLEKNGALSVGCDHEIEWKVGNEFTNNPIQWNNIQKNSPEELVSIDSIFIDATALSGNVESLPPTLLLMPTNGLNILLLQFKTEEDLKFKITFIKTNFGFSFFNLYSQTDIFVWLWSDDERISFFSHESDSDHKILKSLRCVRDSKDFEIKFNGGINKQKKIKNIFYQRQPISMKLLFKFYEDNDCLRKMVGDF